MIRVQYFSPEEREELLNTTSGYLVGEENLIDGDYLVFDDAPLKVETLDSVKDYAKTLEDQLLLLEGGLL